MKLNLNDKQTPANVRLDELDEQILWELASNARIPNNALAAKLHVSPSTTLTRIRAMKESNVIRSYHTQIHLESVGLHVQAIVFVRLHASARTEIRNYAKHAVMLAPVLNVFFLGGPDDFLIHVACTSTGQLRDFVATKLSMDAAVATTQTHVLFDHMMGNDYMDHFTGMDDMRRSMA